MLWPDHCVQGTDGAEIAKGMDIPKAELIIRKGFHNDVDSYSAFLEADKDTHRAGRLPEQSGSNACSSPACHRFLRRLEGDRCAQ